jgi:quercetin dioxygenase-like cupin family protein
MSAKPFVVAPSDYPPAMEIVGERITVLASGEATAGYEIFLQQGPEGSGPPPHNHPWDESFYVTRGEMAFGIDERTLTAGPGTLVHLPAGTTHWFRFGKGGGEMISMTSWLAASRMFAEFAREIAPVNPDLGRLVGIAGKPGMKVVV